MRNILFLTCCVILNTLLVRGETFTSVVNTKSGPVRGIIATSIENVPFAAFKGIPFAKPPVKELRFKPPVEIDPWTDVYNATTDGSVCPQFNTTTKTTDGSEDCLFINVFTPHAEFSSSISKPVMVWIYGGAFISGNSNQSYYGPDFILGEDIVLVSFNYRLGAFGYLNLEHENATGNCGFKDQTLALKWVKKNIAQFGGNPNNVTIFGQSAGGVSVDVQVLSDMSVGLFQKSISMSGGAHCLLFMGLQSSSDAIEQAFRLGSKLGTNTKSKDELLKALYNASASDIINAANIGGSLSFRPTLERTDIALDQEKFLTDCTLKKFQNGNYTKGPHMMGFTTDETLFFIGRFADILNETLSHLNSVGSLVNNIPFISNLRNAAIHGVESLSESALYSLIKQTTNLMFVLPVDAQQKLLTSTNDHPVYYYRFSFNSNYSLHKALNISLNGVAHADELPYLFYMPLADLPLQKPEIATLRKRMVKLWTNFAKFGNPTPNGTNDEILGITWPDSRANGEHLEIGENLSTGARPTDLEVKSLELIGLCSAPPITQCKDTMFSNVANGLNSIKNIFG